MFIRNATETDRAAYLSMAHTFFHSDAVCHPIPDSHLVRTFDAALSGNPFLRVVMLEYEGEIAGFGHISFTWSAEAGGMVVLLEDLYIKPAFRCHKLGTAFFETMFRDYGKEACRYRLEVSQVNTRAKKLYERLGFEELDYIQMILETPKP